MNADGTPASTTAVSTTTKSPASKTMHRATIVGGGPAGSTMAIFLAGKHGFEVDLYEERERDAIAVHTIRSYNFVLMKRGLLSLQAAGIDMAKEVGGWLARPSVV